jgi:hypothetical protein
MSDQPKCWAWFCDKPPTTTASVRVNSPAKRFVTVQVCADHVRIKAVASDGPCRFWPKRLRHERTV